MADKKVETVKASDKCHTCAGTMGKHTSDCTGDRRGIRGKQGDAGVAGQVAAALPKVGDAK